MFKGVLFDLDGTLLDTALDMASAANKALADYGYPAIKDEHAYQFTSHGSRGLFRAALGGRYDHTDTVPMRRAMLNHYFASLCVHTKPYQGIDSLLGLLLDRDIPWGIVTNKPGWLTDPLVKKLPLLASSRVNISGDTFHVAKPHPMPLLAAADQLEVQPGKILYVGDAERDIQAGNAAGMTTCAALWGYLSHDDQPQHWGAHRLFTHPDHLTDWLR